MNGIILYADDDVLNSKSSENKLFRKFNNSTEYSVLPITNLEDLEKTISCVSTFRALLLDWTFKKPKEDEDMPDINENPLDFLKSNKIYSLVYIYSRESLSSQIKDELINIYGDRKIFFEQKSGDFDENQEFDKICKGISAFEDANKHMEIPFVWSQSINKSAQKIFNELEQADSNWVKEIMDTAKNDGGDACSEVISIFQNILNETLIQDNQLRTALLNYNPIRTAITEDNTARLYRRLFYTQLTADAPIMTGDVFKFSDKQYGILITPECEICNRKETSLDFLVFSKDNFNNFLDKQHSYKKDTEDFFSLKDKRKENLQKIYNNESLSDHLLPSFPFDDNANNQTAYINFKTAYAIKEKKSFENCRLNYKLNSPYIHQLRQRYIAFIGRYGVPAIPNSLRTYNLK